MGIPTFIRFEQPGCWYVTSWHLPPVPRLVSWNLLCQDCQYSQCQGPLLWCGLVNLRTLPCFMLFTTGAQRMNQKPTDGASHDTDISYMWQLGLSSGIGKALLFQSELHMLISLNCRIPGVLWQGLSVFAFVTCKVPLACFIPDLCWLFFLVGIRPNNVVLNQLFGGFTGLSLIPITFDWT